MIDTKALPLKIEYVGETVRDEWPCFEWRCTLSSKAGFWSFPYYCGKGHVEVRPGAPRDISNPNTLYRENWERRWTKPKAPTADDVLHSLISDAAAENENFHDWCADYGYSDDSITALNTYRQCLEIATQLRKHLGREVVDQLREQLRDH